MTRSAGDVGAGLAPARSALPIRRGERIHVVGAAGAGASAAALLSSAAGAIVSGCDPGGPSPYTPPLEAAAIPLSWAHDPRHVVGPPRPDRLAVTKALTAIDPDNAELSAARQIDVPVEAWQQVVADAATGRTLIGVAGTHGKSTSAAWLVHVLVAAGLDPAAFVGALLPGAITGALPATARVGHGPHFVVEADEYAGNFDPFRPSLAIVTNVDWDHSDVFAGLVDVLDAVESWLRRAVPGEGSAPAPPTAVINVADPGGAMLARRLSDWPGRVIATALIDTGGPGLEEARRDLEARFSTGPGDHAAVGRIVAADMDGTTIEIRAPADGPALTLVRLPTAGQHNAANALGVAAAALALGLAPAVVASGLASFPGVGRRLERLGEAGGVVVYDDYGHHPTAIRATLAALRQREPARRIWAVYEPLTYHRTAAMLEAFADVLATADAVAIAEIWAGRDTDRTVASAARLADAVTKRRPDVIVAAPGSVAETAAWLAGEVQAGDAVLVLGGGRSYEIGPLLLEALKT